ncbi:unnamed protein product [Rotaria socialis]|uniref:F-box domain-containing protein n=1 Tax=Rotaria socialis TaxID=392032 RepID=A0A818MTH5_9BILA|nr:unnamed protein product [Rotaria socialis]CAF4697534.1 unnamed protein product [Rotaria socialis]
MTYVSKTKNLVELLDLPDEMILAIMNKIKPRAILLYSMIGIKNIRLEQLALGQCHSIDLTSDYCDSQYEILIEEFISFTLPCVFNYIESLTINIVHIQDLDHIAETIRDRSCFNNLKHLKIMAGRLKCTTEAPFRTRAQLHTFDVNIMRVHLSQGLDLSQISLISCPNLKELKMRIYRNIFEYEKCIIPLLQRLSSVEHLTLLLAIGANENRPSHFTDGLDLQRDIIPYMPNLFQFDFHIRSILKNADHIELDKIRQSCIQYEQHIDYFNNQYRQCQIYSLPFIGTRLDFISNRFPLFNVENRFSNVTMLLLYDDIKPFEHVFFQRVARVLPRLKVLEVFNHIQQEEKNQATHNSIEFRHLTTLILHDIHTDYVEQLLCRTYLPCLIELAIRNDLLVQIMNQNQQQVKDNCSKVETLITVEPWTYPDITRASFFPNLVILHKGVLNTRLCIK